MEKLTCPECGKAVAPEALVCDNCGCKIAVCPDCGTVYHDGQVRCTECGRVLSDEAFAANIRENAKKIESLLDADTAREKKFSVAKKIIGILGLVLCLAPAVIVNVWKGKSDMDKLISLDSSLNLCKALFCIGAIAMLLGDDIADTVKNLVGTAKLCSWAGESGFDYKEYVRTYGEYDRESTTEGLYAAKLSEAALLLENKKEKTVFKLMYVFRFAVTIAFIAAAGCWSDGFFDSLFASQLFGTDVEWASTAFYVAVVVLAVGIIIRITYRFIYLKHIEEKRQEILRSAKK